MKPMILIVAIIVCTNLPLFICGCSNEKQSDNVQAKSDASQKQLIFDHLVGTWKIDDGKSYERWSKQNDDTFHSVGFTVNGDDTSWNENARIYLENEKWIFENTVKGQNEGRSVKFISTVLEANSVQFSNPAHDFPTDINYTVVDHNTVRAFIVGPGEKGGKDTIRFNFNRLD